MRMSKNYGLVKIYLQRLLENCYCSDSFNLIYLILHIFFTFGGWHGWLPPLWTSLSLQNFPAVQHTAVAAPHFVTEILLLLQINILGNWRKSRQISVHTRQSTALQQETLHCCWSWSHLNKGVIDFCSGSLQTKPPVDDGFAGKHPDFKWRDHV